MRSRRAERARRDRRRSSRRPRRCSVSRLPDWVIGSDSVVSVDGRLFDKPARPRRGGRASALLLRQDDAADQRGRAWLATAKSTGAMSRRRRSMSGRCPTSSSTPISTPNGPRSAIRVGVFRMEGARRAIVRAHRGRPFHDPRHAAAPAARRASRARAAAAHDQDRAHRLDRHGQVDRRAGCSSAPAFRCSMPTPRFARLQGPGGELVEAIGERFPGTVDDGALDRDALARRSCSTIRASSPRWRRSSIPRCTRRASDSSPSIATRRRCCSTFPCCSKPAARSAFDKVIVVSAPADVQRARVLVAAGHDRGQARRDPRPPDARSRRSARAPISSSTPAATYPQLKRQVARHSRLSRTRRGWIDSRVREIVFDTETTGLTRPAATAWSRSAASRCSTGSRPAGTSTLISIPSATCRSRPRRSTG